VSSAAPAGGTQADRSAPAQHRPRPRAAGALGVVALLAAALTAAELFRAGVPLGPLRKPLVYHLAAAAALSCAGWLWLRRGRRAAPACFAAVFLALALANDRRLPSGDTQPALLLPYALVRHGTLALDGLVLEKPAPPWVEVREGRLWSHYPIATGLLALPVVLPAALGPGAPLSHAEKLAAALMAAASTGFVLATLLRLAVPLGLAVLGASAYAFGSPVFSTAAQALWQHSGGVLALSAALWCTVRSRSDSRYDGPAGLCAGVGAAARMTNLLAAAALVAEQALRGIRPGLRAAVGLAVPLALVALYNTTVFGGPLRTGYGLEPAHFGEHPGAGLLGTLFSPTRGLLTYVPWAPLAVLGLALGARRDRLFGLALAAVAGNVVVHGLWNDWPGGWCYGPRLVSDAMPLLALGLAPLLTGERRWAAPVLVAAAALAIWLHWLGAQRFDTPLAQDVYLGSDVHAMEWWRYPPLHVVRELAR
jgi:hypothetical protein